MLTKSTPFCFYDKISKVIFYNGKNTENLVTMDVKSNMKHEVTNIDFEKIEIKVEILKNLEEFEDNYDKLTFTSNNIAYNC